MLKRCGLDVDDNSLTDLYFQFRGQLERSEYELASNTLSDASNKIFDAVKASGVRT